LGDGVGGGLGVPGVGMGRGFWPGLCVSLKHNSKFASFTLIAKGDFPAELNIPIPFSLISNDVTHDKLVIMPGYWFMYNMYALARNAGKYIGRDKRTEKTQLIEYDFLAPDSINEMFSSLDLLKKYTGRAYFYKIKKKASEKEESREGMKLLEAENKLVDALEILADQVENSNRKVQLIKVRQAYKIFKEMIVYYGVSQIIENIQNKKITNWEQLQKIISAKTKRNDWVNVGGQLIPASVLTDFLKNIQGNKVKGWDDIHRFYLDNSKQYEQQKLAHATSSLVEVTAGKLDRKKFKQQLQDCVATKEWMVKNIYESRAKDYKNPFRQMVYNSRDEMNKVIGKFEENAFIAQQKEELQAFKKTIAQTIRDFKL